MLRVKEYVKSEAAELKAYKLATKEAQRTQTPKFNGWSGPNCNYTSCWLYMPSILLAKKEEFRAMHIAYSMLRGRTYEEIESNAKTPPKQYLVDKYTKRFKEMMEASNEAAA
jgi:hypothetical protein